MNRVPRMILATAAALAIGTAALAYAQEQRREVRSIPAVVTGTTDTPAPADRSAASAQRSEAPSAAAETSAGPASTTGGSGTPVVSNGPGSASAGSEARPGSEDHEVVLPTVRDEDDAEQADDPAETAAPDTTPDGN